jgi:hypothetical protein
LAERHLHADAGFSLQWQAYSRSPAQTTKLRLMKKVPQLPILASLALALPAPAALLVYEGFDYTSVGDSLVGKGGAETGLTGTWDDSRLNTEMFLKSGSLSFSSLPTSGNHIGYESNSNQDVFHRGLDTAAVSTITTTGTGNGSIFFSFLFEKLQNNFGADHEGFALMSGVLPDARFDSNNFGAVGRHGFAVAAVDGSPNLQAVAYDGTAGARIVSSYATNSVPISVVNGGSNTSTSNVAVNLIVGEISFNTGTGGADVFSLYNAIDDGNLDISDLSLIATIEANVDESSLDTLNLTRQVNVNYDEVRIGTTMESVLVPEPSIAILGSLGILGLLRRRRQG